MSFEKEVEKIEQVVWLPFVLMLIGVFILALTVWKGVSGFWPSTGVIAGGLITLVGAFFKRIYK